MDISENIAEAVANVVLLFANSFLFMIVWNMLATDVFEVPALTYWKCFVIVFLAGILNYKRDFK